MNSDLTFITPKKFLRNLTPKHNKLATGHAGQANEKNQTLLDRFRVLIKDTRFFDVLIDDLMEDRGYDKNKRFTKIR